jgi:hypothetical protein
VLAAVTGAALPAPALVTGIGVVIVLSALVALEQLKSPDESGVRGSEGADDRI